MAFTKVGDEDVDLAAAGRAGREEAGRTACRVVRQTPACLAPRGTTKVNAPNLRRGRDTGEPRRTPGEGRAADVFSFVITLPPPPTLPQLPRHAAL